MPVQSAFLFFNMLLSVVVLLALDLYTAVIMLRVHVLVFVFFTALSTAFLSLGWYSSASARQEPVTITDVAYGRYALLLVNEREPEINEAALLWHARASVTFPEIRFVVVVSTESTLSSDNRRSLDSTSVSILVDEEGYLLDSLEPGTLPGCIASVDGVFVRELLWPFNEHGLVRMLTESAAIVVHFPDPLKLVGAEAPNFRYTDAEGEVYWLRESPHPLLLVFVNPDCTPCLDSLPLGEGLPDSLSIAILLAGEYETLSDESKGTLSLLQQDLGAARTVIADISKDTLTAYNVARSPTFVLVDAGGVITWVSDSALDSASLAVHVQAVLQQVDKTSDP